MLPVAILAGGYATRLGQLTKNLPKCLIEVNGKPFVDWQLELLIKNGFSNFVFCVSYKADLIQKYLGDGSNRGINIRYSLDGGIQLGTGGAIQKALPLLGEEFAVIYGDSFLPINYLQIEKFFRTNPKMALMTVYKNWDNFEYSNVKFFDGLVLNYTKGVKDSKMQHIDYGLSYFRSKAFPLTKEHVVFDLSELQHELSVAGNLAGYEVFERFYEVGSVQGIKDFSQYLKRG